MYCYFSSHKILQEPDNPTITNVLMEKFTPICQRFTDVMTNKNYLQHLLFTRTYSPTDIVHLTLVIIKLQILANSLQTAQVFDTKTHCRYVCDMFTM